MDNTHNLLLQAESGVKRSISGDSWRLGDPLERAGLAGYPHMFLSFAACEENDTLLRHFDSLSKLCLGRKWRASTMSD